MHHPPSQSFVQQPPRERSMADVWHAMPDAADRGALARAVAERVAAHAPLAPVHVAPVLVDGHDEPTMRPRPYRDAVAWSLLKHLVQVALVVSVLLFVLQGGAAPLAALAYVATAILLVGVVVVADRQRFMDRDPAFEIVEFLAPAPRPAAPPAPARDAALTPLLQQMQHVLVDRVDVT